MRARMSLEELVERSDVIVRGELTGIEAVESSTTDIGAIRVDEVIRAGSKAGSQSVPLEKVEIVLPSTRGLVSSDQVFYRTGQRGIWLLRAAPGTGAGKFLADNPQRLQPETEAGAIRTIVAARRGGG